MSHPYKTIIIGFGQIAEGLSHDSLMAKYFHYATHIQVLRDHPDFECNAVVDPSAEALKRAKNDWGIEITSTNLEEIIQEYQPDVAVITTPPQYRNGIIQKIPSLKGVFVEKPLAAPGKGAYNFVNSCNELGLKLQVNFWRRGVKFLKNLANGELKAQIGHPQAVFATYGNGIFNNGSHLIDMIRMLLGEIIAVQATAELTSAASAPLKDDVHVSFVLTLKSGAQVLVSPLDFIHYRDLSLDIWGTIGRVVIGHETLTYSFYPLCKNRGLEGEMEIASDNPRYQEIPVEKALYEMYSDLAVSIKTNTKTISNGESTLVTDYIIEKIIDSAKKNCLRIPVNV